LETAYCGAPVPREASDFAPFSSVRGWNTIAGVEGLGFDDVVARKLALIFATAAGWADERVAESGHHRPPFCQGRSRL
jgi:hypothetical protein